MVAAVLSLYTTAVSFTTTYICSGSLVAIPMSTSVHAWLAPVALVVSGKLMLENPPVGGGWGRGRVRRGPDLEPQPLRRVGRQQQGRIRGAGIQRITNHHAGLRI